MKPNEELRPPSKNEAVLADFAEYCRLHPEFRFWQALRNWSGHQGILATDRLDDAITVSDLAATYMPHGAKPVFYDTFHREGK